MALLSKKGSGRLWTPGLSCPNHCTQNLGYQAPKKTSFFLWLLMWWCDPRPRAYCYPKIKKRNTTCRGDLAIASEGFEPKTMGWGSQQAERQSTAAALACVHTAEKWAKPWVPLHVPVSFCPDPVICTQRHPNCSDESKAQNWGSGSPSWAPGGVHKEYRFM